MHIVLLIFGLLLILFGGGCTLIFFGMGPDSDFFLLWLILGVAPLAGGFMLFRRALRMGRERREGPNP
jgi:hypothetical protein